MVNAMVHSTSWNCFGNGEIGCDLFIWNEDGQVETVGSLKGDNGNSWHNSEPWSETLSDKPDSWFLSVYKRLRQIYSIKELYRLCR